MFCLGQGFPDWKSPPFLVEAAKNALEGDNQYARSLGLPELVTCLAERYEPVIGAPIDAMSQVCITNGGEARK